MIKAEIEKALAEDPNAEFAVKPSGYVSAPRYVRVKGLAHVHGARWSYTHATNPLSGKWRRLDCKINSRRLWTVEQAETWKSETIAANKKRAEARCGVRVVADRLTALGVETGLGTASRLVISDVPALAALLDRIDGGQQ